MSNGLANTAVTDEQGQPRVVYHGTSRDFDELEAEAQEEALFGRAFYFTEDRDVARGYAEIRHVPPIDMFDNRDALDVFLAENTGWEAVFVDERDDGRVVAQFRNDEHRP